MSKTKNVDKEQITKELGDISYKMGVIIQCLEVLESSLYFAEERRDKNMSKPCAAAANVIAQLVDVCDDAIIELQSKIESGEV